jgi:hypothetical protein
MKISIRKLKARETKANVKVYHRWERDKEEQLNASKSS